MDNQNVFSVFIFIFFPYMNHPSESKPRKLSPCHSGYQGFKSSTHISSHENKKALSPFYYKNVFDCK